MERGGGIEITGPAGAVTAAQLPQYNGWQILVDFIYSLMVLLVLFDELGELITSCRACTCFKKGGYCRDFYNVLDWGVMLIWIIQVALWFFYTSALTNSTSTLLDPDKENQPIDLKGELCVAAAENRSMNMKKILD
eukprot:SAG11_NODE_562_length_8523_cov_38.875356_5_plen_136_part_00